MKRGATIGISKVARDITEINRTQLRLRQQTEERRRIFETSQDLILVMNSRGFLVQVSPSCQTILGYRPDEMIGRSGEDFIHPDNLEASRSEMRAARRGGSTFALGLHLFSALQVLVSAYGHVANDCVVDAQAAFDFSDFAPAAVPSVCIRSPRFAGVASTMSLEMSLAASTSVRPLERRHVL